MLRFARAMCLEEGWALDDVLPLVTANPARILKLPSKGRIAVGCDTDILLLQVGGGGATELAGWRAASALQEAAALHACGAGRRAPMHLQQLHVLVGCSHQLGRIKALHGARVPALQEESLELQFVIAKGEVVKTPDWVRHQRSSQPGWVATQAAGQRPALSTQPCGVRWT